MIYSYHSLFKTLTTLTLAGAISIATSLSESVQARIQFNAPDDAAPTDTTGGGIRGNIQFLAPGDAAPTDSTGGGIRGEMSFLAPGDAAPNDSTGGGIRGNVEFLAPGDAAPTDSTGGGIRGNVEFLTPGDAAPNDSTGGGIRGEEGFLPPDNAAPNSSTGSGTRSEELTEMIPLLPPAKYGRTLEAHPTMLVYVPPTQTPQKVFFSVQDENRRNLYQTTLELSGEGGIIRVTLPESAPPLELGKTYTWFFAPIPSEGFLRPDNYGVVGWVKRVELPVESAATGNSIDRATAYAAFGVWYDTLNLVASAQQDQPNNPTLASEWKDLLEQAGLEAVATQPLTDVF
jgi:Domain of Unknown Function (DUF928)